MVCGLRAAKRKPPAEGPGLETVEIRFAEASLNSKLSFSRLSSPLPCPLQFGLFFEPESCHRNEFPKLAWGFHALNDASDVRDKSGQDKRRILSDEDEGDNRGRV